ncbi:MAG: energy transducer TonB [Sediminibacterium sp.]
MKKLFFAVIAVFVFLPCFAQDAKDSTEAIIHPEYPAEFIGGNTLWIKYLTRNMNHDLASRYLIIPKGEKRVQQTVKMIFDIDQTGHTTNIKVENLSSVHPELAKEGIRVITGSPVWKPASQDGKPVTDKRRQKLTFMWGNGL